MQTNRMRNGRNESGDIPMKWKSWLLRSETGAGLFYLIFAAGMLGKWAGRMVSLRDSGIAAMDGLVLIFGGAGASLAVAAFCVLALVICAWFAWLLLRKRLSPAHLLRIFLAGILLAAGAWKFLDFWTAMIVTAPLFALAPELLLAERK